MIKEKSLVNEGKIASTSLRTKRFLPVSTWPARVRDDPPNTEEVGQSDRALLGRRQVWS